MIINSVVKASLALSIYLTGNCATAFGGTCPRVVGTWTNGRQSIEVTQDGSNFLITYHYYGGAAGYPPFRFVGPCEGGRVLTNTDWVGDLTYIQSSDSVIFERQTFRRQ